MTAYLHDFGDTLHPVDILLQYIYTKHAPVVTLLNLLPNTGQGQVVVHAFSWCLLELPAPNVNSIHNIRNTVFYAIIWGSMASPAYASQLRAGRCSRDCVVALVSFIGVFSCEMTYLSHWVFA